MLALYPVAGAGAVAVCPRAPGAAPLWIRARWLRPNAYPIYGTKGRTRLLQCMCYFPVRWGRQPVWFIAMSRINMCAGAVRSCSDTGR